MKGVEINDDANKIDFEALIITMSCLCPKKTLKGHIDKAFTQVLNLIFLFNGVCSHLQNDCKPHITGGI